MKGSVYFIVHFTLQKCGIQLMVHSKVKQQNACVSKWCHTYNFMVNRSSRNTGKKLVCLSVSFLFFYLTKTNAAAVSGGPSD